MPERRSPPQWRASRGARCRGGEALCVVVLRRRDDVDHFAVDLGVVLERVQPDDVIAGPAIERVDLVVARESVEDVVSVASVLYVSTRADPQPVIAGSTVDVVGPVTAADEIVSIGAVEDIVARAAEDPVVARAAVHGVVTASAEDAVVSLERIDRVISGLREDQVVPGSAGEHI